MHQGWYLNDGTFVGPLSVVQHAVQVIIDRAPAVGLSSNPQKSRVWSPVHNPQHLKGFPLGVIHEHRAGLTVLGPPVTLSLEFAASVAQAQVDAMAASLEPLSVLRHPQAELLLLRNCLGACKIGFPARCPWHNSKGKAIPLKQDRNKWLSEQISHIVLVAT